MGGFSLIHWIILGILLLLLFGGSRFSTMMGDVAKGLKSFKKGLSEEEEEKERKALQQQQPVPPSQIDATARPAEPVAMRRRDPVLHFCDGHAHSVRHQVARPGSLALASLPIVGATLTVPGRRIARPRSSLRRCRPTPPSRPDTRRRGA